MRKSIEIMADVRAKLAELQAETDVNKRAGIAAELDVLNNELVSAQAAEQARKLEAMQRTLSDPERNEVKKNFSIVRFLNGVLSGKVDGFEAEMAAEGEKELRATAGRSSQQGFAIPSFLMRDLANTNGTEANYGKAFAQVTKMSYVEALRNSVIAGKLGVQFLNNLVGNVAFVKGAGTAAAWLSEEGVANKQKPAYALGTLSPKRLQVYTGVTRDLLHQTSLDVENIIWGDITKAHAEALDAVLFNGAGSNGEPTGIRNISGVNTVAMGTNGDVLTYAKLVAMETVVGDKNALAGVPAYVANSKTMGAMKTTAQVSGYPRYIFDEGKANGYDCYVSNALPSNLTKGSGTNLSSMIFGDFSQAVIASWGGLDFIVDPLTAKDKGVIEITGIAYHDIAVRHPEAFAKIDDIKIA